MLLSNIENDNIDIVFGDFTMDECSQIHKSLSVSSSSIIYNQSNNLRLHESFIVFGDFTPEECFNIQKKYHSHTMISSVKKMRSIYYELPCMRCGYHSHRVNKCVARRNRYGEWIDDWKTPKRRIIPTSPTYVNRPIYYNQHIPLNNWCIADKTDYTEFIFSEKEIQEWIEEEDNKQNSYSSLTTHPITSDANLDYILGYSQALTDHMLYYYSE